MSDELHNIGNHVTCCLSDEGNLLWSRAFENLLVTLTCLTTPVNCDSGIIASEMLVWMENIYIQNYVCTFSVWKELVRFPDPFVNQVSWGTWPGKDWAALGCFLQYPSVGPMRSESRRDKSRRARISGHFGKIAITPGFLWFCLDLVHI